MTRTRAAVLLGASLLVLSGCSGDGDGDPKGSSETAATDKPETHTLEVAIGDDLPATIYYNKDNRVCTVSDFFTPGEVVSITVRDSGGSVIGTATTPEEGGEFQKGAGCVVYVSVEVPASDFYEVSLSGGTNPVDEKQTVEHEDGAQQVQFHV